MLRSKNYPWPPRSWKMPQKGGWTSKRCGKSSSQIRGAFLGPRAHTHLDAPGGPSFSAALQTYPAAAKFLNTFSPLSVLLGRRSQARLCAWRISGCPFKHSYIPSNSLHSSISESEMEEFNSEIAALNSLGVHHLLMLAILACWCAR